MKVKLSIIGIVGVPANYGGFETLIDNLIEQLDQELFEITIYCSIFNYSRDNRSKNYKGCNLIYLPIPANGGIAILYDNLSFWLSVFKGSNLILSLGTSSALSYRILKFFSKIPFIVNIDGQDNKREKFNPLVKRLMSSIRTTAIKHSTKIIADNYGIIELLPSNFRGKSVLIEYGGDHTKKISSHKLLSNYNIENKKYCFGVARIEPENNIHIILQAFASLKSKEILVYVGNWNANSYGKELKEKYGRFKNIRLLDAIYELEKLDILRSNCKLYIHGHSRGGTNPSLVEAMCLGLPIFAFDVNFNRYTLEENGRFFKTSSDLDFLISTINHDELHIISQKIKEVAFQRYTWKSIGYKYSQLFLEEIKAFENVTKS